MAIKEKSSPDRDRRLEAVDRSRAAFRAAHTRYLEGATADAEWAALVESLFWITGLDDMYEAAGGQAYRQFRDDHKYGHRIPAMRIPRNAGAHAGAPLIETRPPQQAQQTGINLWSPRFLPLGELESWLTRAPGPQRRGDFDRHAGSPIRYHLRAANRFFIGNSKELDQLFLVVP